ncbi:tetratricopeptide repeat protein [Flammeovirga sp. SJP92]|uniref:tetratricopeptide repeat protein n=1 Tax=Flammeovirga sp. SJP92 TaxID=1775430 RepID=UPI00155F9F08|nr:tetratricopeptide repeat protein [Flammeovirga sp. SJP92]
MKRFILLTGLVLIGISGFCQTKSEKQEAYNKAKQAVELMDNGNYDMSIQLLEEATKLDPTNFIYPYEIGYALILKKKYKKATKYFEKVVKMEGSDDQSYQMLGNAYSMGGNKEKAIDAYNRGLKKYPNSGRLYLEIGNVHQDDWNKALEYYEKGVQVDPTYPSNYYWLAKIFCNSTEEIWGMFYGEMFMNIERNSKRTEEISQLLFDTYKSEIQFTSDTTKSVSFSQNNVIDITAKKPTLPYSMIYETGLMIAVSDVNSITLKTLHKIRSQHTNFYFDQKFNDSYPNVVFDWHKTLIQKEMFECYNYWLMMKGAPDEFDEWIGTNQEKFESFINWFSENPMPIDNEKSFHRLNF